MEILSLINYIMKMKSINIIIILLVIITNNPFQNVLFKVDASFTGEDATPPAMGDWIIDSGGNIVTNETIILNGNLIIKNGGTLIFRNVTLLMNCPTNGSYNIEVESGGYFFIFDNDDDSSTTSDASVITSAIPDYNHRFYFYIKKGAIFEMKNSELHECGYKTNEPPNAYWTEGLCIEANNSLIENCTISNNLKGVMLYYYSNHSKILSSKIIHNLDGGIYIGGIMLISYLNNISIENCIIASNGKSGTNVNGISIGTTKDSKIINCSIYHHPLGGISIGDCYDCKLNFNEIINNNYGIFLSGENSNVIFSNNTVTGNLEYSIYNYINKPFNVEHNYFGTNNEIQINRSIKGQNVDYTPWLVYRESDIQYINKSQYWKYLTINIDDGLIINGNLTLENSKIILNNSYGKNFLQVNGKLIIENSSIFINKSLPDIYSVWGFYTIQYSFGSSGYLKHSIFQDQKGINVNNEFMNISNCVFIGNLSQSPLWSLLIRGDYSKINDCNITGFVNGIQLNSDYNTIIDNNIYSNSGIGISINGNNNNIKNCSLSNQSAGIFFEKGMDNKLANLNLINNSNGIFFWQGFNNSIINSNFDNNSHGIYFFQGINNTIKNCNFTNNENYGILIFKTSFPNQEPVMNNSIFHNNFISNGVNNSDGKNAKDTWLVNEWDNGYPEGGNYWDDYTGKDYFSGENQSIRGSDNIGDSIYYIAGKIVEKTADHYPLMFPVDIKYYISDPILSSVPSPNNNGNFKLSWTSISNATNYTVYEENNNTINKIDLGPITSLNIFGKENGTYNYFVQAKNDKVVSRKSNTITVVVDYPPIVPNNFLVEPLPEGNALDINWLLNENDTLNYSLWCNYTGQWQELQNITHPNNSFIHNGLTDGEIYYYKIKAWDGINQSSKFSIPIQGIPNDILPPTTPTGLNVVTTSNASIELIWESNKESDLKGYDIYRTTNIELNFTKINDKQLNNTSYFDIGLNGNITYYYRIQAFDEVPNYSEFSNVSHNTTNPSQLEIISYSPKGIDIQLDSQITIEFSKPMNKLTVERNFRIIPDLDGDIFWDEKQQIITFSPTNNLNENITYNITLISPIFDLEGGSIVWTFSWEFTTLEFPKIIQNSPQGDFVDTDTILLIKFNNEMVQSSVEKSFSINPMINGTFKWLNNETLVFEFDNGLNELTIYEITIDYLAQDMIGNKMGADFTWSFKTGDFTTPKIISYSPTGDDISIDAQISIVFSEQMNKSSVEARFSISPGLNGQFIWQGNTLVFQPDEDLEHGTKYTVKLSMDVTDIWGNTINDDLNWEFTTEELEKVHDNDSDNNLILIVSIISIVIILIIIFILIFLRKRKEPSKGKIDLEKEINGTQVLNQLQSRKITPLPNDNDLEE